MAILETKEVVDAWNEFTRFKRYGLPLGKGILDEPYYWFQVIDIIDSEFAFWEQKQYED